MAPAVRASRRVVRPSAGFLIALLIATVGAIPACDGRSAPAASVAPLPVTLDLRMETEAVRWRAGPAIASLRHHAGGLAIQTAPGTTAGRHVERALAIGRDQLGKIEIGLPSVWPAAEAMIDRAVEEGKLQP